MRPLLLILAAILLGCGSETTGQPKPVPPDPCADYAFTEDAGGARVFLVQPRTAPEHLVSHDAYAKHLRGLVDARVKPCLAKDRSNVIAFPEDVGLPAIFIGSRGEAARAANDITGALFALAGPYAGSTAHYEAKWANLAPFEAVFLGATDTIWRGFYETLAGIAAETGAYVTGTASVSGEVEKSTDPADLAALRDPDLPQTPYVYVARDRAVYNTAFVIAPSGEIVGRMRKPYLVEAEEALSFTWGALAEVVPVAVGPLRLGVHISKDAWMPDVVDRQEALGADVFLQPEAFSGWGIEEQPGDWLPDVFLQSAWQATQKHAGYRFGLVPHLAGNLFDQVFDGQSAVIADAVPGKASTGYVGQEPRGGFVTVAPWVVADPGLMDTSLSLEDRRAALRQAAKDRLPHHRLENQYIETVVAADVDPRAPFPVTADGPPGALGASRVLAEAPAGQQSRVVLASAGDQVIAAWQDDRDGRPQIYAAVSPDGGKSFGPAAAVAASMHEQGTPAVVMTPLSIYVAFQERDGADRTIRVARSADGGETFAVPVVASADAPDAWAPALTADGGSVHLAFVGGVKGNERIFAARVDDGTETWSAAPVDAPPSLGAPNPRNNQWSPAIVARNGQVAIAWVDFRAYQWDVLLARSTDGGLTFAPATRIDDATGMPERLHDDPALAFTAGGELLAAWTDVRLRRTPAKARVMRETGSAWSASAVLGPAPEGASTFRPKLSVLGDGRVVAVWQDDRTGGNDIHAAVSNDGGASWGKEVQIDDGGEGASYQFAPSGAGVSGGRVVVAWEDTRSGKRRIRVAAGGL